MTVNDGIWLKGKLLVFFRPGILAWYLTRYFQVNYAHGILLVNDGKWRYLTWRKITGIFRSSFWAWYFTRYFQVNYAHGILLVNDGILTEVKFWYFPLHLFQQFNERNVQDAQIATNSRGCEQQNFHWTRPSGYPMIAHILPEIWRTEWPVFEPIQDNRFIQDEQRDGGSLIENLERFLCWWWEVFRLICFNKFVFVKTVNRNSSDFASFHNQNSLQFSSNSSSFWWNESKVGNKSEDRRAIINQICCSEFVRNLTWNKRKRDLKEFEVPKEKESQCEQNSTVQLTMCVVWFDMLSFLFGDEWGLGKSKSKSRNAAWKRWTKSPHLSDPSMTRYLNDIWCGLMFILSEVHQMREVIWIVQMKSSDSIISQRISRSIMKSGVVLVWFWWLVTWFALKTARSEHRSHLLLWMRDFRKSGEVQSRWID